MKSLKGILFFIATALIALSLASRGDAQTWMGDFEKLCAEAEVADSLPTKRLRELVLESDRLLSTIEASNEPKKKLYLFRLRKCRDLFRFMVNLSDKDTTPSSGPATPPADSQDKQDR